MKRALTFLLAAVMLLSLAACGGNGGSNAPAGNTPANNEPAAPAEPSPVSSHGSSFILAPKDTRLHLFFSKNEKSTFHPPENIGYPRTNKREPVSTLMPRVPLYSIK